MGCCGPQVAEGTRPHAVMYSAVDAVLSGKVAADVILGDTSGRLHTNTALMGARRPNLHLQLKPPLRPITPNLFRLVRRVLVTREGSQVSGVHSLPASE